VAEEYDARESHLPQINSLMRLDFGIIGAEFSFVKFYLLYFCFEIRGINAALYNGYVPFQESGSSIPFIR
jgi:hypothetical protein